jgi:beta-mannanase
MSNIRLQEAEQKNKHLQGKVNAMINAVADLMAMYEEAIILTDSTNWKNTVAVYFQDDDGLVKNKEREIAIIHKNLKAAKRRFRALERGERL